MIQVGKFSSPAGVSQLPVLCTFATAELNQIKKTARSLLSLLITFRLRRIHTASTPLIVIYTVLCRVSSRVSLQLLVITRSIECSVRFTLREKDF